MKVRTKDRWHFIRAIRDVFTKNWGLKLLALLLAVVIYHTLKPEAGPSYQKTNDKRLFDYR